jgi:hypothetical protein
VQDGVTHGPPQVRKNMIPASSSVPIPPRRTTSGTDCFGVVPAHTSSPGAALDTDPIIPFPMMPCATDCGDAVHRQPTVLRSFKRTPPNDHDGVC